jgi:chromosome segregation ATPase
MKERNETSRFTMRDNEAEPDSIYTSDAENLRIEKLSSRITVVAVLIPCLLAVILIVVYLDLKNRVANTHSTGSMGVQNLSKDLESRFSNLSLKLAKIEDQLKGQTETLEATTASLQVNLKKATTDLKRLSDGKPDKKALATLSKNTQASIEALQKDLNDLNAAFGKFDEELASQIMLMAAGLKKDQARLAAVEKKSTQLDAEKLSKSSMDLAIGLERLALQEMVKERIRALEKKLTDLNRKIDVIDKRLKTQAQKSSPVPSTASTPKPSPPPSDTPAETSKLVEQTIE